MEYKKQVSEGEFGPPVKTSSDCFKPQQPVRVVDKVLPGGRKETELDMKDLNWKQNEKILEEIPDAKRKKA